MGSISLLPLFMRLVKHIDPFTPLSKYLKVLNTIYAYGTWWQNTELPKTMIFADFPHSFVIIFLYLPFKCHTLAFYSF